MCATCRPGQKVRVPESWRHSVVEMTQAYLDRAQYASPMCEICRYRFYVWLRRRGLPSLMDAACAVWLQKQRAQQLRELSRERSSASESPGGARG